MRPDRAFHLLTAAVVLTGVLALELSTGPGLFLAGTLVVCVAYYLNETGPRPRHLPDAWASVVCVAAFLAATAAALAGPDRGSADVLHHRVLIVGHFLVVAQWVFLLRRRTHRDYAWVHFITFSLFAGAALLTPELPFALFYVLYLALAMGALRLLCLKQDAESAGSGLDRAGRAVGAGFVLRCGAGALLFLVPVACLFALLPRGRPGSLAHMMRGAANPITGFSEAVRLGDIGRILQSSGRVMQVRISEPLGGRLETPNLLMRGAAFDIYDAGRWKATHIPARRAHVVARETPIVMRYRPELRRRINIAAPLVKCDVALEPLDTKIIFAPYAIDSLSMPYLTAIIVDTLHDTVYSQYERRGVLQYEVVSRLVAPGPPPEPQSNAAPRSRGIDLYLQLPPGFPPRVRQLAERVCRIREEDPSAYERATRILSYLSRNREFRYTLDLPEGRESGDPIDNFLFNRREGHCEYFASAMVVLLRCVGVPARLVNGFKGGEWNEFGGYITFRQRDAHSWAEAYIEPIGWTTFDPSPLGGADPVRRPRGVFETLRSLFDFIDRVWVEYVVSFDTQKQSAVYRQLERPGRFAKALLVNVLWHALGEDWLARGTGDQFWQPLWKRTRPFLFAAGALAVAGALARAALSLRRRVRRRSPSAVMVPFYEELLRLLRRRGFQRPAHLTPAEFAQQVISADGAELAGVGAVTRRFYEVRFGGRRLTPKQETEVRRILAALAKSPRRRASPQRSPKT